MNWKKLLLIGIGWGLGTAVGLALIVGGVLWYDSRPRPPVPPKSWNSSAIKADYDFIDSDDDKRTILFYYTLENTTDFDYRVEDGQHVTMTGRLEKEQGLAPFVKTGETSGIDFPIFVPAKKRVRLVVHLGGYTYSERAKQNATKEERKQRRAAIEKYVADELSNLDGFDLLDETNRYEIVFPSGWKKKQ